MAIVAFEPAAMPAAADGPGSGAPYIVTLGDSAISGEGGRWAGNANDDDEKTDALGPAAYFDGGFPGAIGAGVMAEALRPAWPLPRGPPSGLDVRDPGSCVRWAGRDPTDVVSR
jgi:hypothetical protein